MNPATHTVKSQNDDFRPTFRPGAVQKLPAEHRGRIEPLLARVLESTKRRRRILGLVQDCALSHCGST